MTRDEARFVTPVGQAGRYRSGRCDIGPEDLEDGVAVTADDLDAALSSVVASLRPATGLDWSVPAGSLEWDCWHTAEHGRADPEGFAAMGCVETLLHGDDIAQGLGLAIDPPRDVCARLLAGPVSGLGAGPGRRRPVGGAAVVHRPHRAAGAPATEGVALAGRPVGRMSLDPPG
ncbi:hypothetical protein [Micromonospora chersina]|uniref:hypothetical protein n=1 Tax=Micromonospora chersina TaxID=47854 RepID=UPI00371A14BF